MGRRCDLCEENKYRDGFECQSTNKFFTHRTFRFNCLFVEDCPACYREVQKRVNRYRKDLNLLQDAILTLNSSQTLNTLREDKRLTGELDGLAKNLNNLKVDLQRWLTIFFYRLSGSVIEFSRCWTCFA